MASNAVQPGLKGKKVLITAASGGIGKATALAFAAAGADVAVNGRSAERLQPVAEEARKHGVNAVIVVGDLAKPSAWEGIINDAVAGLGGLDILVNNGPGLERDLDASSDPDGDEVYDMMFRVNVRCPAALMRFAAPHLKKSGAGAVVNVSSVAGSRNMPNMYPYCVAKAGLDMLTRAWAMKLSADRVRVNAVAPGSVDTPLFQGFCQMMDGLTPEVAGSWHLLGRISQPEEQAAVILFLASDAASFMTGAVVPVEGGWELTNRAAEGAGYKGNAPKDQ